MIHSFESPKCQGHKFQVLRIIVSLYSHPLRLNKIDGFLKYLLCSKLTVPNLLNDVPNMNVQKGIKVSKFRA